MPSRPKAALSAFLKRTLDSMLQAVIRSGQMIVVGGSSGGDRRVLLHTAREWCAKSLTERSSAHLVTQCDPDRSPMKYRVSRSSIPARATTVDPTPI